MFSSGIQKNPAPLRDTGDSAIVGADADLTAIAQAVGERKRVLVVGCTQRALLPKYLTDLQCDVVGLDVDPAALEAARPYCTRTVRADLNVDGLESVLEGYACDALVFNGVLEHLLDPAKVLEDARGLLLDGGFVVACVPNVAHGAVRLALLSGRFDYAEGGVLDPAQVRFFTAKSIDEMLLGAGYAVASTDRMQAPIFGESPIVPSVVRADYSEEVVAEVERDAESQTAQFVVKAVPFSNEARYRAVGKRFLAVNTELASALQRIESLGRAREHAEATLVTRTSELDAVRAEYQRVTKQRDEGSSGNAALTAKAHALEIDIVRREERLHFTELRLEETRTTYEARITDLLGEVAELRERDPAIEQLAPLQDRIRQLTEERDRLLERQTAVSRQTETLTTQRDALLVERDELKQWREILIAKSATLESDLREAAATAARSEAERDTAMLESLVKDDDVAELQSALTDAEELAARERYAATLLQEALSKASSMLADTEAAQVAATHRESQYLADLASAKMHASRARSAEGIADRTAADLNAAREDLRDTREQSAAAFGRLHADIASAKLCASRLIADLAATYRVVSTKQETIEQLRERVNALHNSLAIASAEDVRVRAEGKLETLEAVRRAERAEKTVFALSQRNQELSLRFVRHVRELTASMLNASSEVASLIDATQSSKPWALKAALRRVFRWNK